jgi:hypothetical protein
LIKLFLKSRPFCSDTYLAIMEKHICMMADLHVRAHFVHEHILHSIKLQAQQIIIKNKNKNKTFVGLFFFILVLLLLGQGPMVEGKLLCRYICLCVSAIVIWINDHL